MDMRQQILTVAQRLVQERGFNGFSYADIAEEVGIRKASVHHHFPTKNDLGVALIESYTQNLVEGLAQISTQKKRAREKLLAFIDIFRQTLAADRMCMGGMLAADALALDATMLPGLKRFFIVLTEWLTKVLAEGKAQQEFHLSASAVDHARLFSSSLQGAVMLARVTEDPAVFERAVSVLMAAITRKG